MQYTEILHIRTFGKVFITVLLGMSFLFFTPSFAATVPGALTIADTYPINDSVKAGDIISVEQKNGSLVRSRVAYDQNFFGVYVEKPDITFRRGAAEVPIVQSGIVAVNVTALGGAIASGDLITTSSVAGKGQKARPHMGYIIGRALEAFDGKGVGVTLENGVPIGRINVLLGNVPNDISGTQEGAMTASSTYIAPPDTGVKVSAYVFLRYLIAGLVALSSIIFGFTSFRHNLSKGMESIGRNPLAKSSIQAMIVVNALLTLLTVGLGIFLAILIIVL